MKLNFVLRMFILVWSIETGRCQEGICKTTRGMIQCCVGYREINGSCILCPEGYHGWSCNTTCPDGLYGRACRKFCECSEKQICDPMRGCVFNFTEINLAANVSATTEIHFTVTQQIGITNDNVTDVVPWQYLSLTPGGVILFLIAVCIYIRHRKIRKKNAQNKNAVDSVNDASAVAVDPVEVPAPIVPLQPNSSQGATGSDYAEIHECVSVYGDSHEVSSVYNVLSFSRNKTIRQTHGSIQAVYDTSQLPALRNETFVNPEILDQQMDDRTDFTTVRNERQSCPL